MQTRPAVQPAPDAIVFLAQFYRKSKKEIKPGDNCPEEDETLREEALERLPELEAAFQFPKRFCAKFGRGERKDPTLTVANLYSDTCDLAYELLSGIKKGPAQGQRRSRLMNIYIVLRSFEDEFHFPEEFNPGEAALAIEGVLLLQPDGEQRKPSEEILDTYKSKLEVYKMTANKKNKDRLDHNNLAAARHVLDGIQRTYKLPDKQLRERLVIDARLGY